MPMTTPLHAAEALASFVPRLARIIASALQSEPTMAISLRQYRLLERLLEQPARTSALASTSGVSQATASAAISALEGRGLVERSPDPEDRRASLVTVTEAGRALYEEARRVVIGRLSEVTLSLPVGGLEAVAALAPEIVAAIDRDRHKRLSGGEPTRSDADGTI